MTTAYTSLLGLALPVTGELSGTWGDTVNTAITTLLDSAIAGTTTLSTDADVTLTTTTGAANTAREAILLWNPASGTTTRNITAPAQSKIYTVINASGGTQSIVIRGTGPTTGVTIVKGESAVVAWNGTDFVKVSNTGGSASFTNVTVTGTTTLSGLTASTALALNASKEVVSVTNTGTGSNVLAVSPTLTGTIAGASLSLSSLTSGRVTYAGTAGLLQDSANLQFDGTNFGIGGAPTSALTVIKAKSTAQFTSSTGTNATYITFTNTGGNNYIGTDSSTGGDFVGTAYSFNILTGGAYPIVFSTGNTDRGRFDSSGRFFVGTNAVTTSSSQSGEVYSTGATGFLLTNTTAANYPLSLKNQGTSGSRNLINFLEGASGGTSRGSIYLDGSNNIFLSASNAFSVGTGGTATLTLDTSGQLNLLTATSKIIGGTAAGRVVLANSDQTTYMIAYGSSYAGTPNIITFITNSSNVLTYDASGNLGQSITPSNWESGGKVFQISLAGAGGTSGNSFNMWGRSDSMRMWTNAYFDGGTYVRQVAASIVPTNLNFDSTGAITMQSAPSGAAGSTFVTANITQFFALKKDSTLTLQGGTQSSGIGVAFPATQSASSNANTLDDYEEGTFTPVLKLGATTQSLSGSTKANYTKIGNIVYVTAEVYFTKSGTGDFNVSGLPFTSANIRQSGLTFYFQFYTSSMPTTNSLTYIESSGSDFTPQYMPTSGTQTASINDTMFTGSTNYFYFAGTYQVA